MMMEVDDELETDEEAKNKFVPEEFCAYALAIAMIVGKFVEGIDYSANDLAEDMKNVNYDKFSNNENLFVHPTLLSHGMAMYGKVLRRNYAFETKRNGKSENKLQPYN
jgi:hypothetical protein